MDCPYATSIGTHETMDGIEHLSATPVYRQFQLWFISGLIFSSTLKSALSIRCQVGKGSIVPCISRLHETILMSHDCTENETQSEAYLISN